MKELGTCKYGQTLTRPSKINCDATQSCNSPAGTATQLLNMQTKNKDANQTRIICFRSDAITEH